MTKVNYNHQHQTKDHLGISGAPEGYTLTVGDIRDAIAHLPDDAEIALGTSSHGETLQFYRFKSRGENVLGIEFN